MRMPCPHRGADAAVNRRAQQRPAPHKGCTPASARSQVASARHERDGSASATTSVPLPPAPRRSRSRLSVRDVHTRVAAPPSPSSSSHVPLILSTRASLPSNSPAVTTEEPTQPTAKLGRAQDLDLYDEIKACDTWQDVLEVIADEAPGISLHTATQAASKLVSTVRASPLGFSKAVAMLHMQPAFQALVEILTSGVPRMSRAQLCNSLHALAQLKVALSESAFSAYSLRTQQLALELNARDIAQLMHGWGTLKRSPGQQAMDLVGFRAKLLLEEGSFEPQGLSMMLTGLAAVDYRNHLLLSAAASVATLRMDEFTPQGVSNVCTALGKLGHVSLATMSSAARVFVQRADEFKVQETCNLLWAMTQLRYHPQEALAPMVRQLVQRSSSLKPVDFSMLFHALGTFGVHPGNQFLSELLNALPKQLPRCSAAELCSVLWGLGMMGETRQPVFAKIATLLPDQFQAGALNEGLLRQVFQAFLCSKLDQIMYEEDNPSSGNKNGSKPQATVPVSFPPVMMEAMKRAWRESALASTVQKSEVEAGASVRGDADLNDEDGDLDLDSDPNSAASASGVKHGSGVAGSGANKAKRRRTVKEEIATIVRSLRVQHELARPTKDGIALIDVAIRAQEDRFIALQIVMEHEHTCNTGQFLGPLQFQTRVLEMNGWEVRHVRAQDFKQLDHTSKPLFMSDLLRGMGVRVARSKQAGGATGAGGAKRGVSAESMSAVDMLVESTPDAPVGGGRRGGGRGGRK